MCLVTNTIFNYNSKILKIYNSNLSFYVEYINAIYTAYDFNNIYIYIYIRNNYIKYKSKCSE